MSTLTSTYGVVLFAGQWKLRACNLLDVGPPHTIQVMTMDLNSSPCLSVVTCLDHYQDIARSSSLRTSQRARELTLVAAAIS